MKNIGLVVLLLLAVLGLTWVGQGNDFFLYKVFAPAYEDVRRDVFENTKSYREGMAQNVRRMQEEYVTANAEHKDALASIILHTVADVPNEDLPQDVVAFVTKLRSERGLSR